MKILGASGIDLREIKVPIGKRAGKVVELTMRPVKLSKLIEIEAAILKPVPPSTGETQKDPKTGKALKRNGRPLMVRDGRDEKYLEQVVLRSTAVNVATVLAGLGDQISDLPKRTDEQTAQAYWLGVLDKLTDMGIDTGIFQNLVAASDDLSAPLSNLEILMMRKALGTEKESPALTEDDEQSIGEAIEKEEAASGKSEGVGAPSSTTSSKPPSASAGSPPNDSTKEREENRQPSSSTL
ncbi:hypothetical protein LCGC14_0273430 [marine sediment metagenome]|uniref:Uncharacterized protein n=2 Tax=root TaxID=1 RepID=A0A9C9TJT1_9HYPH|nr:hypothetical protein [Aurantimonas coralicida]